MQNNNPEALMGEFSNPAIGQREAMTDTPSQTQKDALRRRYEPELRALSRFICGHEYVATASGLFIDDAAITRAASISAAFQMGFLRRELLTAAIQHFRHEIRDLLRPYEQVAEAKTAWDSIWSDAGTAPSLELRGDHLNLLHRLVLTMIFREGYVVRACGLMLGCHDTIVHVLRDEGLTRINVS